MLVGPALRIYVYVYVKRILLDKFNINILKVIHVDQLQLYSDRSSIYMYV